MTDIATLTARMREAAEKATPGPWKAEREDTIFPIRGIENVRIGLLDFTPHWQAANAAHIAASNPANVLALCAELERVTKERDAAREF